MKDLQNVLYISVSVLLFLLCGTACQPMEDDRSLEGRWHLVAYEALDGSWLETEPDHIARAVWIDCSDKGRRGRFEGQTVTNPITGLYRLREDRSLEVYELAGTLHGEPDWGDRFWAAMGTASTFERAGSELRIVYADSTKQMIFSRVND